MNVERSGVMKKRAVRRGERVFEITICPYWLYILKSYSQWAIYSQVHFRWVIYSQFPFKLYILNSFSFGYVYSSPFSMGYIYSFLILLVVYS